MLTFILKLEEDSNNETLSSKLLLGTGGVPRVKCLPSMLEVLGSAPTTQSYLAMKTSFHY